MGKGDDGPREAFVRRAFELVCEDEDELAARVEGQSGVDVEDAQEGGAGEDVEADLVNQGVRAVVSKPSGDILVRHVLIEA